MSTNIFEYSSAKLFNRHPVSDAFFLIDNRILAIGIFLLGLLVYGYIYHKEKQRYALPRQYITSVSSDNRKLGWVGSALLALGAFSYSYGLTDEVFVNLAHPLNLLNHDIFSFSPQVKSDGTVEPLFYFLHIIGGSRQGIIVFNFLFSYALLMSTGYLVDRFFIGSPYRVIIRNLYLLFPPIVYAVSGGFGAVLINFLFVLGLLSIKLGNVRLFCVSLFILALSRPEALAYDLVLVVLWFIYRRQFLAPILTTILGVVLFYSFYRYYYGHWIPTPLYFKAYPIDCPPYYFSLWKKGFMAFVSSPYDGGSFIHSFLHKNHLVALYYIFQGIWRLMVPATILIGVVVLVRSAVNFFIRKEAPDLKCIFALALIFLLPILTIYTSPPGTLGGNTRYYLILMSMVYLTLISTLEPGVIFNFSAPIRAKYTQFIFLLLVFFSIFLYFSARIQLLYNRNLDASVGRFFSDLPSEFTLASSELNTFGYYSGRDIVDLWGYTNLNFSKSDLYSLSQAGGRRVNPYYFLQVTPAIAYNMAASSKIDWSTSRRLSEKYGDKASYDYSPANILRKPPKARRDESKGFLFPVDPGWLLDNLAMPIYYGNPNDLYAKYDVVFIHDEKVMFAFLLRKDLTKAFQSWAELKTLKLEEIRETSHIPTMSVDDLGLSKDGQCSYYY